MKNIGRSFLFHLILVLLVILAIYIIFFFSLHQFTKHGEEYILPGYVGMNVTQAVSRLDYLGFTAVVDSVYEPTARPLTVLRQSPDSGALVKEGRLVFLTVNMVSPPSIPMPALVGLSFGSARMLLRTNKLFIGDTIHKPFIKSGVILEQLYRGYPIKEGQFIAQGSKITLQVGDGMGNTEHRMPDVMNINCEMALAILSQINLQVRIKPQNESVRIPDTMRTLVTGQVPGPDAAIKEGDTILLLVE